MINPCINKDKLFRIVKQLENRKIEKVDIRQTNKQTEGQEDRNFV